MTPPTARPSPDSAPLLAGRYRVGQVLGRGGMAEVREAVDERLGRPVAIKFLLPALASDPGVRRRFELEARTAAQIQHPNVVGVLDVGETADGQPWIVMERLPGRTLRDEMRERPMSEARAREVGAAMLDALAAAHAAGVLHRDIKPANVLLDTQGRPKVADFGIAKSVGSTDITHAVTATGMVLGTVAYLAPERLHGAPATPADDVWAVAVVLYEALAGAKPFTGDTPAAVAATIAAASARPLATRRPNLDPSLAVVIDRALSRDEGAHFHDAAGMAQALARRDANHPPAAPTLPMATATALQPAGPTMLPQPGSVSRPSRHGPRWAMWGVGALVAAALAGLLWLAAGSGTGSGPTTVPVRPTTVATTTPTTVETTTTASTTSSSTTSTTTKPKDTKPSDTKPSHGKKG